MKNKIKNFKGVKIHDLQTFENYVVYSEEECRDDIDKSIFNLVLQFKDTITMGKTIGELI